MWAVLLLTALGGVFFLGALFGIALRRAASGESTQPDPKSEVALVLTSLTGQAPIASQLDDQQPFGPPWTTAIESLLNESQANRRSYQGRVLAEALTLRQIGEAVDFLASQPPSPRQLELLFLLLEQWGQLDGRTALAYALDPTRPFARDAAIEAVLAGWARQNPNAAWNWVIENPSSNARDVQRHRAILTEVAARNPVRALEMADLLSNLNDRHEARQTILARVLEQNSPADALTLLAVITDPAERRLAEAAVITQWARVDPTRAATWVDATGDEALQALALPDLTAAWAQTDPARAAAYAYAGPAGSSRARALENAIDAWIDRAGPVAPAEWLNSLQAQPDLDPAVATLSLAILDTDPATAMSWILSLADPDERFFYATLAGREWLLHDPSTARASLEADPNLTPAMRSVLLGRSSDAPEPFQVTRTLPAPTSTTQDPPPEEEPPRDTFPEEEEEFLEDDELYLEEDIWEDEGP